MNNNQKKNYRALIIGLSVLLALLVIGFGGIIMYLVFQSGEEQTTKQSSQATESEQEVSEAETSLETEPFSETETSASTDIHDTEKPNPVTYDNGDVVYRPEIEDLRYDEDAATVYYNNMLLVYLFSDLDSSSADVLAKSVGGIVAGKISGSMNVLQILVEPTDLDGLNALADILMESEDVLYASYDYPVVMSETGNDNNPWSSDGKVINGKGCEDNPDGNDWWAEAINAYTAWGLVDGLELSEVKAGVLDNGFDMDHEDLEGNLSLLHGYEENTEENHGTHVSGIIAAINNDKGIRGIADTASLICADWSPTDTDNYLDTGEYIEVIKHMIESGTKVINNSWGNHFQSEEGYTISIYWSEVGYFSEISDTYIRLKNDANRNGYDSEYTFHGSDRNNVKFYIDSKETTYEKFNKKVKDGSFIGIVEANNEVTEVYLIENGYEYLEAVRNTGAYESYVSYMETHSKRTALDSVIMIIQLLQNGQDDFIMVQAAGNGYDNSGPGVDAMWSCFFSAVDEDIYNLLSSSKRESLEKQGITYNDIANRIMIVGAVDNIVDKNGNYQMTYFSNYGDNVDICAPGENIYSTVTDASGNYETESGTSMAAPMVTGAAALLWQVNPDLSAPEVKELLENSTSTFAIGVGADAGTYYPMLDIGAAVKSLLGKDKEEKTDKNDVSRDVVLVLDRSGSMSGEPLEQTKEAAVKFIDTVFEKDSRVSVVTYDEMAFIDCGLTDNQQELEASIDGIYSGGSTNMYEGLEQADNILQNSQADRKIIVLMSDGLPNEGANDNGDYHAPLLRYAEELKNKGYYVYTLGFFSYLYYGDLYDAQQLLEGIASPGLHYEVNSADDLVFFFDDIANQISGTRFVYIRIACPVDVTVTSGGETLSSKADSENTRTSFGALTYESVQNESEEEYGDYYYDDYYAENTSQDQVKILRLNMDQDYDVEIEGYDSGTMDYTVSFPNDSGEYDDVRLFPDIEVTASTKATSNTGEASATYLKVDKDGDGKIDTTYKTEANGKMEEVKDHKILYIVLIVVGVVILLVILLIIILACVSGKKKRAGQGSAPVMTPAGSIYGAFGIFNGQSYPLCRGQQCVVGRKSSCDIQLVHGQVSRTHCVIEMLPDGVYQVTDYSSNGTYYNDQKLKRGEPYRLPKGALLAIGDADNVLELR